MCVHKGKTEPHDDRDKIEFWSFNSIRVTINMNVIRLFDSILVTVTVVVRLKFPLSNDSLFINAFVTHFL